MCIKTSIAMLLTVFTLFPLVLHARPVDGYSSHNDAIHRYSNTSCRNVADNMRQAVGYVQAGNDYQQVGSLIEKQYVLPPQITSAYEQWITAYMEAAITELFGINVKPYMDAPTFSTIAQMSTADYASEFKVPGWRSHTPRELTDWAYHYCEQHPLPSQLIELHPAVQHADASTLTCADIDGVIDQMILNMEPYGGTVGIDDDLENWADSHVLSNSGQQTLFYYFLNRYKEIRLLFDNDPRAHDATDQNITSDIRDKILFNIRKDIHYKEAQINAKQCPDILAKVQADDSQELKRLKAEEDGG